MRTWIKINYLATPKNPISEISFLQNINNSDNEVLLKAIESSTKYKAHCYTENVIINTLLHLKLPLVQISPNSYSAKASPIHFVIHQIETINFSKYGRAWNQRIYRNRGYSKKVISRYSCGIYRKLKESGIN